jgi:O-antigen/teichoic acid export membrane protein
MGILGPAQRRLMAVAALVYLPVVLLAPSLFAPVFGNAWLDAGLYAAVLAPMVAAWTVASPLTRIFLVRNRLRVKLAFDVLNMVVPIGALAALRPLGPLASLGAYSAGGCLVAAGVVVVARRLSAGAVAA